MFWRFSSDKNGLDDKGRTYKEALIDHIKWCMETVEREAVSDFDFVEKANAMMELKDHYFQFIRALEEQGPHWKKIITEFLEGYHKKPIAKILQSAKPLYLGNPEWKWMPFNKEEAEMMYKKSKREEKGTKKDNQNQWINKIIKKLLQNQYKIFKELERRGGDVELYFKIKAKYKHNRKHNIGFEQDDEFRNIFIRFYRLNSAGLTNKFKDKYFSLLDKKNDNLQEILSVLYEFKTRRGYKTVQLSFATKLIHTINNNKFIFDRHISNFLNLKKPRYSGDKNEKIKNRIKIYSELIEKTNILLEDNSIKKIIRECRERFNWPKDKITDIKVLDFIIWAYGAVNNENNPRIPRNSNDGPTIYKKIGQYVINHYKEGKSLTSGQIKDKGKNLGIGRGSIIPSDYCDNVTGKAEITGKYKIFHRTGNTKSEFMYVVLNHDIIKKSCNL